ncbi:hypothetical protein GCM10020255_082160 [Rhodococcus baikonurensis]
MFRSRIPVAHITRVAKYDMDKMDAAEVRGNLRRHTTGRQIRNPTTS